MIAAFAIGLLTGLTFAAVFFICWRGERHITKELHAHLAGEEDRNHDSYDAGVRTGQLYAELGVAVLNDFRVNRDEPESPHHSYSRAVRPTNGNSAA